MMIAHHSSSIPMTFLYFYLAWQAHNKHNRMLYTGNDTYCTSLHNNYIRQLNHSLSICCFVDIMKTIEGPLKSLIKMLQEMQKNF